MTECCALLSSLTRDTEVYEKFLPLPGGAICAPIFLEMLLGHNGLWKTARSEHSNLNLHKTQDGFSRNTEEEQVCYLGHLN